MSDNVKKVGLADAQGDFVIYSLYIKDLSFENPRPPFTYSSDVTPEMGMEVRVNVMKLFANKENDGGVGIARENGSNKGEPHDLFEVSLFVNVTSKYIEDTAFILQVEFAGVFGVNNSVTDDVRDIILFVHCANVLFPYARKIVADTISDAGYQPLIMQPVNFMGMYRNKRLNAGGGGGLDDENGGDTIQ